MTLTHAAQWLHDVQQFQAITWWQCLIAALLAFMLGCLFGAWLPQVGCTTLCALHWKWRKRKVTLFVLMWHGARQWHFGAAMWPKRGHDWYEIDTRPCFYSLWLGVVEVRLMPPSKLKTEAKRADT